VRRVTASAPGKLFLAGEYAVLAGAPALVAAVDRRAHVRAVLEPGAGPLEVESLAEGTRRVIHDPERDALGGGDAGAVLAALRSARTAAPSLAAMRARVVVDTRAFLADGQKLGLGRSAATVAAAVAALLAGVGRQDRGEILQAALAAHALFQEGRGSGADVAAAVRGGVLEFRRERGEVTVRARVLPRGNWQDESGEIVQPAVPHFLAQDAAPGGSPTSPFAPAGRALRRDDIDQLRHPHDDPAHLRLTQRPDNAGRDQREFT